MSATLTMDARDDALSSVPRGRSNLRRRVLVLIAACVVMIAAIVIARTGRDDPIARALDIARDDRAFATATEGGAALTRISVVLQDAGEGCAEAPGRACDHFFAASAHARVSAVSVLSCTRRGVLEAQASIEAFLVAISENPAAPMPAIPSCPPRTNAREEPRS